MTLTTDALNVAYLKRFVDLYAAGRTAVQLLVLSDHKREIGDEQLAMDLRMVALGIRGLERQAVDRYQTRWNHFYSKISVR